MKRARNNKWSQLMTWLDFGGQRSKVRVTAEYRGGTGIHVDAGASMSIFGHPSASSPRRPVVDIEWLRPVHSYSLRTVLVALTD